MPIRDADAPPIEPVDFDAPLSLAESLEASLQKAESAGVHEPWMVVAWGDPVGLQQLKTGKSRQVARNIVDKLTNNGANASKISDRRLKAALMIRNKGLPQTTVGVDGNVSVTAQWSDSRALWGTGAGITTTTANLFIGIDAGKVSQNVAFGSSALQSIRTNTADYFDKHGQPLSKADWEKLMSGDAVKIAVDKFTIGRRDYVASTLWLGKPNGYRDGYPLIFETVIVAMTHISREYQHYSATIEEAKEAHTNAVKTIKGEWL